MKIDGTRSSSDVKKKSETKKSGSANGSFKTMVGSGAGETSESRSSSMSSGIASVDALLAAQTSEDPAQQKSRKRMQERANTILDKLNELKVGILTGSVTVGHMVSIADVAATHREKITDPELSAILDEIDLRAQIELAKLQMARKKTI